MAVETEIKLQMLEILGDRAMQQIVRDLAGHELPRGLTQHLVSTYFDTEARDLAARKCSLRLRRAGNARVQTQTLKLPVKAAAGRSVGLQTYHEYECAIPAERPDLSMVSINGDQSLDWLHQCASALQPTFVTDIRRTSWLVERDGSKIEIAWDRGDVRAGARMEPVNELELELKAGDRASLFALARSLGERLQVRLGDATKAERGEALLQDGHPLATRAGPVRLSAKACIGDAFQHFAAECIGLMRANERSILAGHQPDAVHQFRVALRRLRAMISACGYFIADETLERWSEGLRWAHQSFGRARDLDVLVSGTLAPLHRQMPEDAGLAAFTDLAMDARDTAHRDARAALCDRRYTLLLLDIMECLNGKTWERPSAAATLARPAKDFAVTHLRQRYKKVRSLAERWPDLTIAERHRLRIHVKKLRYLVAAFASLFPVKSTQPFQLKLERLQDVLGGLNDAWVGRQYVNELSSGAAGAHKLAEMEAVHVRALLGGWYERGIVDWNRQFDASWSALVEQQRFWKL